MRGDAINIHFHSVIAEFEKRYYSFKLLCMSWKNAHHKLIRREITESFSYNMVCMYIYKLSVNS